MSKINQLLDLLKQEPDDLFLNYALGLEYAAIGDTEKAITLLSHLNAKAPEYLPVYYQLAQLHEINGTKKEARKTYEKGVEIARMQKNNKTLNELQSALQMMDY